MGPVGYRLRAEARARWRAWLGLAVVIGLAAGGIVALAAGARRTDSAYSRYLEAQNAADVMVVNDDPVGDPVPIEELDAVADRPEVAESAELGYSLIGDGAVSGVVALDDRFGRELNRIDLVEGRLPDPDRPEEVAISPTAADATGVDVGDTLPLAAPSLIALAPSASSFGDTQLLERDPTIGAALELDPVNTLRVVGIATAPGTFPPQGSLPCCVFHSDAMADLGYQSEARALRLVDGVSGTEFREQLEEDGEALADNVLRLDIDIDDVERSIHVQTVGLWLLAGLGLVVAALVAGQLLSRLAFVEAADNPTLDSIGMGRRHRVMLGLARAAVVGGAAAVVAVPVAVALSPLFPTGLARTAEPDAGLSIDLAALGIGALATVTLVLLISTLPVWLASAAGPADESAAVRRPNRLLGVLLRTGAPLPAVEGTRMATVRGRGRNAVPVVSTLGAVVLGVAALVAGLTFGASLRHLLDTPRLYGVAWDVEVPVSEPGLAEELAEELGDEPGVDGTAVGSTLVGVDVEGHDREVPLVGLDPVDGDAVPPTIDGRRPADDDEIALGTETMEQLDVDLGDEVRVRAANVGGASAATLTVVGRTVLPNTSLGASLGHGGLVTVEGLSALTGSPVAQDRLNLYLDLAPDAESGPVVDALMDGACTTSFGTTSCSLFRPVRYPPPSDVANFGRAANVPGVMGGVFALAAAATLMHVVVTSVRRRARDLAMFRTLGFTRRQLVLTVAASATTVVLIGLAVGVPLGIVAGRWLWIVRAVDLGVAIVPRVPATAVVLVAMGALVVANAVALLPGRAVARSRPAEVLGAE